jgi:hypothetical protein
VFNAPEDITSENVAQAIFYKILNWIWMKVK